MEENLLIQQLDLTEFISLNVRCIEFFGYFCPQYIKTYQKICYYVYSVIFVGFAFVLNSLSQFANMIVVFGDIEKMTEASFILLTNFVQTLKLYSFIFHRTRVRNLINGINREEFKPKNWNQYKMLSDDIEISKKITRTFLFMCFVTCSLWGVFPFLDKTVQDSIRLPLSGWYPFNIDTSPMFEFIYGYQIITTLINGCGNISMDTFLSGIIMVISGQLSILNNSFQILKCKYGTQTEKYQIQEVGENLIRNVVHYKNIIQFSQEMTSLFTICIMGQFIVSVIIMCITMFQMSLVSVFSLQFLSMALYQTCILLEIYLWCYYGNEVILKSEKLTESAYLCEWTDCSEDFKKDLLFFMTRSQKSLKLYAGGYFTLSLGTFMTIVKSSWSYFAVLNQVHSVDSA